MLAAGIAAVLFGPLAAMLVAAVSFAGDFGRPYLKWISYTSSRAIAGCLAGIPAFETPVIAHGFGNLAIVTGVSALVAGVLDEGPALQRDLALVVDAEAIAGLPDGALDDIADLDMAFAFAPINPNGRAQLAQPINTFLHRVRIDDSSGTSIQPPFAHRPPQQLEGRPLPPQR